MDFKTEMAERTAQIETRYCKNITKKTNEADGQIRCIKLESDCEGEQS